MMEACLTRPRSSDDASTLGQTKIGCDHETLQRQHAPRRGCVDDVSSKSQWVWGTVSRQLSDASVGEFLFETIKASSFGLTQ